MQSACVADAKKNTTLPDTEYGIRNTDSDTEGESEGEPFRLDEALSWFKAAYPNDAGLHAPTLEHAWSDIVGGHVNPAEECRAVMDGLSRMITSGQDPKFVPAENFLRKFRYRESWGQDTARAGPTADAVRVAETWAINGDDEGRERLERYAKCGDGAIEKAARDALKRLEAK